MKVSCALYVEIEAEEELLSLDWNALPQPVMVLGGGSNLLFTGDFPGTVLHFGEKELDQVQGNFGPGPILGARPGPASVASRALRGTSGGPGPGDKVGPGPNIGWTRSNGNDVILVTVPANTVFDDFCAWAAAEGLWGSENLSLIPGECGASAVQNIGAYGVEVKDILADIRAYDRVEGRFVHIDPATCGYGYRTSKFKTEWKGRYIITAVTYRLSKEPRPVLDYGGIRKALEIAGQAGNDGKGGGNKSSYPAPTGHLTPQVIRDVIIGIRNKKLPDPAVTGSAGSFFCNPVISREHFETVVETARKDNGPEYMVPHFEVGDQIKVPAAWMIEQCGFKGARDGGAQVYPNQPLVIVNASGDASPEEIIGLERQIIDAVAQKYGITLHPEVEHV